MTSLNGRRRGVTLLELLVAIVIIGVSTTVILVAWKAQEPEASASPDDIGSWIADARRRAIATGRSQQVRVRIDDAGRVMAWTRDVGIGSLRQFVAHPDGSVVADSAIRVERLSGSVTPRGDH
jgi:prepilin-type N-terminal cleavage/methylation domain-containing protein